MSYRVSARSRSRWALLAVLAGIGVAFVGVVVHRSPSPVDGTPVPVAAPPPRPAPPPGPPRPTRTRVGESDGVVGDGVTVFDGHVPAVGRLDPDLLDALRAAAGDAGDHGLEFVVNSGWRSVRYQEQLLREAVAEYGSEEEAARWVSTPDTSLHVSGDAVDLGPPGSTAWLAEHGARYGLCQIYDNEPWHYELRPDATGDGCPDRYADPTRDPRTWR